MAFIKNNTECSLNVFINAHLIMKGNLHIDFFDVF